MESRAEIRERLVEITKRMASRKDVKRCLAEKRAEHRRLGDDNFLWHHLLQSFSTMGASSGSEGLIKNQANYNKVTYETLDALDPNAREAQVRETFREAKLRWPQRKTRFILGCYDRIKKMGGPRAAKEALLSKSGCEEMIDFLDDFPGISKKYARNIMMDVYHENFHNTIAIDIRIQNVSDAFGLIFSSYEEHEEFYLSVAKDAGLNGWSLDRILYNYTGDFLKESPGWEARTASSKHRRRNRKISGGSCG